MGNLFALIIAYKITKFNVLKKQKQKQFALFGFLWTLALLPCQ